MPAASFSFQLEQGSDFQIVFRYLDSSSNPVNLTNMHVLLRFQDNNGVDYSFDNITETSDYSLTTTSDGLITFTIPAKITDTYTFSSAQYELDIQEPNEVFAGAGTKSNRILFENITAESLIGVQDAILDKIDFWLPFVEVRDIQVSSRDDNTDVGANEIRVKILFNIKQDPNTLDSVTLDFSGNISETESTTTTGGY